MAMTTRPLMRPLLLLCGIWLALIAATVTRSPNTVVGNLTVTGILLASDGTAAAPSIAFASALANGIYASTANKNVTLAYGGNAVAIAMTDQFQVASSLSFTGTGGAGGATDIYVSRAAANALGITTDAARTTNTADIGTATTALRSLYLGTSVRSASNGVVDIGASNEGLKRIYADYTNTGTVGAVTINKMSGRAIIAAGASSVVVTNSLVTAASRVFPVLAANDTTALYIRSAVTGAGSFTITTSAAATANTAVDWLLINAD